MSAVTFTRAVPGAQNAADGTYSAPTTTTITGSAVQVRGNPMRYDKLGLVLSTMPTLLFTPDDYGLHAFTDEFVQPGDQVVWNSATFTVRDVDPVAPDGTVILARIVVAQ